MSLPDITSQQSLFDQVVADTGCTGSDDLIACLRTIPLTALMTAVNSQDRWQASVDGHLIVRNPLVSVQKGLYAKVVFRSSGGDMFDSIFQQVSIVTGDCEDEGTYVDLNHQYILRIDISGSLFFFASTNITYVSLQHHF